MQLLLEHRTKQCNGTREAYNVCVCDVISSWKKNIPTDSLLVLTSSGLAWNQIKFPKHRLVSKFQAFNYSFWLVRAERQSLLNRQKRRKTNTNCSKVVFKQANCQASTQYWRKQVDQVQKSPSHNGHTSLLSEINSISHKQINLYIFFPAELNF